jgi:hypothetical protein
MQVELGQLIDLLLDNRIAIMTHGPGDRPVPPLARLHAAGVRVFSGSDAIRDAWTPFGNADMLERAMLLAWRNGFRTDELLHLTLHTVPRAHAEGLGLQDYALDEGRFARSLTLPPTLAELVVAQPTRLGGQSGRVVTRWPVHPLRAACPPPGGPAEVSCLGGAEIRSGHAPVRLGLFPDTLTARAPLLDALRQGLLDLGYEGRRLPRRATRTTRRSGWGRWPGSSCASRSTCS